MTATSRPRGLSVRVRLALSYAGFLIVAGVALFAVGFLLLRFVPDGNLDLAGGGYVPSRADLLEVFVRYTWWAIGGLTVFGLVGGWILAGIVLRPLDRITDAARQARDGRLDRRVALPGRGDELTDLADTFDAMLDRIQHTIDEERRFAANASHELRTPHAIIRTMVEVAQADPGGRDIERVLQRIGATNDRAIATTEALLTLARLGRGGRREVESVDLADVVGAALTEVQADAAARRIRGTTSLPSTPVTGNRALLQQLAANLVRNAVVHNEPDGWVRATVAPRGQAVELRVDNGGAVLDAALVKTLAEPFVRGAGRVRGDHGGSGLGLALVASIARAHGGSLEVAGRPDGGLQVRVLLPR